MYAPSGLDWTGARAAESPQGLSVLVLVAKSLVDCQRPPGTHAVDAIAINLHPIGRAPPR